MQPLEDDLHGELDVAGFARADGRSAVEIADGVGHHTKSGGGKIRRAPVSGFILRADVPIR